MRSIILLLLSCGLICFTTQQTSTLVQLRTQEQEWCKKDAENLFLQRDLKDYQQAVLLNLLYHMYRYAEYDALFRKHLATVYRQLIALSNEPDPEETRMLLHELKSAYVHITKLSNMRARHFSIWQLIDDYIDEQEPTLLPIVNTLKNHARNFLKHYIKSQMPIIDRFLTEHIDTLRSHCQTTRNITRTFDLLLQRPQLLCDRQDMVGLKKMNTLYDLAQTIHNEADQLLTIKEQLAQYAHELQDVSALWLAACYHELQNRLLKEDNTHVYMLFDEHGIIKEPTELLPAFL